MGEYGSTERGSRIVGRTSAAPTQPAASPSRPSTVASGPGLPITRAIDEAHGGTVSVESAGPGQGVTVVIRLPLANTLEN